MPEEIDPEIENVTPRPDTGLLPHTTAPALTVPELVAERNELAERVEKLEEDPKARNQRLAGEFFDDSFRFSKIYWIAAQGDQPDDDLVELISDLLRDDEIEKVLGINPRRFEDADEDGSEYMSILYDNRKTGYLVLVEMPVPRWDAIRDGGTGIDIDLDSYWQSWSYSTGQTFYTDSLDEAFIERVREWKKETVAYYAKRAQEDYGKGEGDVPGDEDDDFG